MCGIVCAFDLKEKAAVLRPQVLEMSKKIRHRGPDWSGIYNDEKAIMAHERLAIVIQLQESNLYLVKIESWFWRPTGKFITTENCVSN